MAPRAKKGSNDSQKAISKQKETKSGTRVQKVTRKQKGTQNGKGAQKQKAPQKQKGVATKEPENHSGLPSGSSEAVSDPICKSCDEEEATSEESLTKVAEVLMKKKSCDEEEATSVESLTKVSEFPRKKKKELAEGSKRTGKNVVEQSNRKGKEVPERSKKRARREEEDVPESDAENHGKLTIIQPPIEGDEETHAMRTPRQRKRKVQDKTVKPLHDEVVFTDEKDGNAANRVWSCKHCRNEYTSSYTRIHYHFFGPAPGKTAGIKRCTAMLESKSELSRIRQKVEQAEKLGVAPSLTKSVVTQQKVHASSTPIKDPFAPVERQSVDQAIERFFCANGISFNVLRSPQFEEMAYALKHAPAGYKIPSYERARTTLLDECKRDVEKQLAPIKDTWSTQGVSIVSDGWSNVKNEALISVIADNSRGAVFMRASDFSEVEKTGSVIAEYLLEAIDEVGASNVVQVVTDNAANCAAAGNEIQTVHKHIFWSPCVLHTINLAFKDLANEFSWIKSTYSKSKMIVKYIVHHQKSLAMFRAEPKLELLKVAKTRFASHYVLLKRLLDCKEPLEALVCVNNWKDWVKNGDENNRKVGQMVSQTIKDDNFWEEVENVKNILQPLYRVLRFADTQRPTLMAEIYERMDNMLGEIMDIMATNWYATDFKRMKAIIEERWNRMNVPLQCLGFALNPHFYHRSYLELPAPGGLKRKRPNKVDEVVKGVIQSFEKIAENEEESAKLRRQFAMFHMKEGIFSMQAAQADSISMDAITWWSTYGSQTPELAEVAIKVLSQPISSCSAKRNWSTYKFIHSVIRHHLNSTRAEKLVFTHSNLRLISRLSNEYKSGASKKWDVEPDDPSLDDSSVRLLELTWENLDSED